MPNTVPLIELRRAGFRQQGTDILLEIDWRVEPGEHWAILGPNGSGKTSLMRVACGYRWHTSGVVKRLGEELADLVELRKRIGWVSGEVLAYAPPEESAMSFVVSGRFGQMGLRAMSDRTVTDGDFADARKLLEAMSVDALAEKPLRVLSQGERQQVLVARARMTDPVMLVLDEPCAGMDPATRERFLAWLGELMAEASTPAVMMITHHVEEVLPQFERALLIGEGRIVAAGPTAEVVTATSLAKTYDVNVARLIEHGGRLWPIWDAA
jgi:iron complex transport system ATP-binding protein